MRNNKTQTSYVTEAMLLALDSDARVEVVDGEIVEMSPTGGLHVFIGDNIYRLLYPTISQQKLGYLFSDSLIYHLSRQGQRLLGSRVPDVSFVRKAMVPPDWDIEKPFPGAPTLAIEVMSPDDDFEEMLKKIGEYFNAGTEEVWVVFPRRQDIYIYRPHKTHVSVYSGTDIMDVSHLFPGLAIALEDVFRVPRLD